MLEAAVDEAERITLLVRIEQQTERNIENGLAARAWDPETAAKVAIYEARSDRRLRKLMDQFFRFRDDRSRR